MVAPLIKFCGFTCQEDVEAAIEAGADLIGLNLVPGTKRAIDEATAASLAAQCRGRVETVAVVADRSEAELRRLLEAVRCDWLQLHGNEAPSAAAALAPRAMQALRIATREDVSRAAQYTAGPWLVVDSAGLPGELGGSGQVFDWRLVAGLAAERPILLAGGLHAGNVREALRLVRPHGVDVASGIEEPGVPRRKSPERMKRFVAAVRAATG